MSLSPSASWRCRSTPPTPCGCRIGKPSGSFSSWPSEDQQAQGGSKGGWGRRKQAEAEEEEEEEEKGGWRLFSVTLEEKKTYNVTILFIFKITTWKRVPSERELSFHRHVLTFVLKNFFKKSSHLSPADSLPVAIHVFWPNSCEKFSLWILGDSVQRKLSEGKTALMSSDKLWRIRNRLLVLVFTLRVVGGGDAY